MKERKRSLRGTILLLAVMFLLSGKDAMAASYSDWSTTYPSGQQGIESKTQYRYSDYVDRSQWVLTKSGSVDYVPSWPAGFNTNHALYRQYYKSPYSAVNNGSFKREVSERNGGYIFWHWCKDEYKQGPINRRMDDHYNSGMGYTTFHAFYSQKFTPYGDTVSKDARVRRYDNASCCTDTYWYLWLEVKHQDYKEYKMDHSGSYWTSWSGWSDTPYKASSTRKVEKRTVYRYKIENEGQWLSSGGYWWYRHADGSCTKNGWEKINGYWYHFDANGWMQTGWIYIENNWYYLGSSGAAYCCGWNWVDGYCYYFYDNGSIARNTKIDGCYVDWSGKWVKDQWIQSGSSWWYRHGDGSCTKDDWEKIDGAWYHFDANGWMQTGWIYIENNWYYLDSSGRRCEGGWQWIGSNCYYFNSNGKMACNTTIDGSYVDSSGKWETDRWVNSGGYWWYRHKDGSCTKNDWEKIGGYWYHFDSAGWMQTGWLYLNGYWYYLNGSGQMCTGWVWVGSYCYYFYSGGSMATDTYIDGYYVNNSGQWSTNLKSYIETLQYMKQHYWNNDTALMEIKYSVYDLNGDGVEELLVRVVQGFAAINYYVFTIRNGQVESLGEVEAHHSTGLKTSSIGGVYIWISGGGTYIDHLTYDGYSLKTKTIYSWYNGDGTPKPPLPDEVQNQSWISEADVDDYSLLQ